MTETATEQDHSATAEPSGSAVVHITYYTDPLCCWSWGFEPQWRLLRTIYAGHIGWRLRMGGMIPSWDRYDDPVNSIHRPGQMGPLWMEAERLTGMPMDPRIWRDDPPESSWPACRACKAAEMQSPAAADLFLRRMRQAVMAEGRNIARTEVLESLGDKTAAMSPNSFDSARFRDDLQNPASLQRFREDLREARILGISRYPALVLQRKGAQPRFVIGWRPFPVLRQTLLEYAPELRSIDPTAPLTTALAHWSDLTDREVDEFRTGWPTVPAS